MKICTFIGHRQVYAQDIAERIARAIAFLLKTDTHLRFYTGDIGEFDSLCAAAVRKAHPARFTVRRPNGARGKTCELEAHP